MTTLEIGLNSSALSGRLRRFDRHEYARRPTPRVMPRGISDIYASANTVTQPVAETAQNPNSVVRTVAAQQVRKPQASSVLARQYALKPEKKRRRIQLNASHALSFTAVLLFVIGAGVAFMGWRTNDKVVAQVRSVTTDQKEDNGKPDESKPSDAAYGSYNVAPDLPRYVRIPKIGVNAMVRRQSVDKKGVLQSPNNVHTAGWYDGSSKPGEGGAVLLDGHVAGPTTQGVFYDLKKLVAGEKIEVQRGDGKVFNYKVVSAESKKADQVDMAKALLPIVPGKSGLNLITCTGKVNGWHYDERLVVYAVQI